MYQILVGGSRCFVVLYTRFPPYVSDGQIQVWEIPDGVRSNVVIAASIFDGSSYSLVAMVSSERHIFVTFSAHPSSTSACMFDLI